MTSPAWQRFSVTPNAALICATVPRSTTLRRPELLDDRQTVRASEILDRPRVGRVGAVRVRERHARQRTRRRGLVLLCAQKNGDR
jgi:hypothetical protein